MAVVTRASAIPADTAARPPEPDSAMPANALMMPRIVPTRPTKGAVEPVVARMLSPFRSRSLSEICTRSSARSTEPMPYESGRALNSFRPPVSSAAK
jgi:hypothetical protein